MKDIILQFDTKGAPLECRPYGNGHVNRTYYVETDQKKPYILQKINHYVFRNVEGLMDNIARVTQALAKYSEDDRSYLHLIPVKKGGFWLRTENGEYWRMYEFIQDSVCLEEAQTPDDFYQSAVGFGRFQYLLRDFPIDTLVETIPNFHNTIDRYRQFHEALKNDACGRAATVQREIDFILAREEKAGALQIMREKGELPVRVTHNDTKLNNVLMDAATRKALCVIDLDTVMPGLVAYDFGDAIRFGASTGAEDEKDLEKVRLDLDLYKVFAKGFIPACGTLTRREIETLPLGAVIMTLENGLRFLADYLNGDVYYSISRTHHNLDRARTQIRLVEEMERSFGAMEKVVSEII